MPAPKAETIPPREVECTRRDRPHSEFFAGFVVPDTLRGFISRPDSRVDYHPIIIPLAGVAGTGAAIGDMARVIIIPCGLDSISCQCRDQVSPFNGASYPLALNLLCAPQMPPVRIWYDGGLPPARLVYNEELNRRALIVGSKGKISHTTPTEQARGRPKSRESYGKPSQKLPQPQKTRNIRSMPPKEVSFCPFEYGAALK